MNLLDTSASASMQTSDPPRRTEDPARPLATAHEARFLDEKQLCAELGISSVTATKWRASAAGPPFIKVGRLVRYRRADVEAWLRSRTVGKRD